jgi:RNA polymerase sigma-70 factor (ECF subfamily)
MTFVKKIIIPSEMLDRDKVFEEEILIHIDAVLTYAYRLTCNRVEAEDLSQEVMFRAKKNIGQYTAGTNGKAWLMRITFNFFVNDYKRGGKTRGLTSELDERTMGGMMDSSGSGMKLERDNLIDIVTDEVYVLLMKLPIERLSILLLTAEGFKNREIAEITGMPEGTVKSNLSRLRDILTAGLAGDNLPVDEDDCEVQPDMTKHTKGNRRSDISPKPTGDHV